jgi:ABC-2 type transport system ATP-binding protein
MQNNSTSDTWIIETVDLTKSFSGMTIPALNHLSLRIKKGEIFGLLGPNGAGKTTLINILSGLLTPDQGKVVFLPGNDRWSTFTGVVPQNISLYPTLSVKENLTIFGTLHHVPCRRLQKKMEHYLEIFELSEKKHTAIKKLSGGMKRRVNIIASLLHEPALLILDEPTAGIDVRSRKIILENLQSLNKSGTTIFYTSHNIVEAETFCSYVCIINQGNIVLKGEPPRLVASCSECNSLEDVFLNVTGNSRKDDQ